MPAGPAFIPCPRWFPIWDAGKRRHPWERYVVPAGYVWSPKTDGTMAGWVRPKGRLDEQGLN